MRAARRSPGLFNDVTVDEYLLDLLTKAATRNRPLRLERVRQLKDSYRQYRLQQPQ
jgi:hypothetical protein